MILALETSTEVCSVCLQLDDGTVDERRVEERGSHSEKLFLFIRELFENHACGVDDLGAVVTSGGPGSYTGLRISASALKGLLFQRAVPLWAANTLASFATGVVEDADSSRIHAVIDARRKHLYHQLFHVEDGKVVPKSEVLIRPLADFENWIKKGDTMVGTGLDRLPDEILEQLSVFGKDYITGGSLIKLYRQANGYVVFEGEPLIQQVDVETFEPNYYTNRQVK